MLQKLYDTSRRLRMYSGQFINLADDINAFLLLYACSNDRGGMVFGLKSGAYSMGRLLGNPIIYVVQFSFTPHCLYFLTPSFA